MVDIDEYAAVTLRRPSNYGTIDDRQYTSHGAVLMMHRDSDVLERSNWRVIVPEMMRFNAPDASEDDNTEDVYVAGARHFLVGWTDTLFVRVRDEDGGYTPAFRRAWEWSEKLADYPLADEMDYSELESQELEETLTQCYDVPEDKVGDVIEYLFDCGYNGSGDGIPNEWVEEGKRYAGITDEDS